ncbi:FtsX-like permease family protein [Streptomyces hainanensis]|uniref:FtsX-like permease family protein n=1 Tax=Streptomyces hainanensis TaxID=402648 RepID=A0A4R4TG67_9ACTN|nr:FtsX-like permease family protein [Streptomyces hainanensis]TDC73319.1 FtsX-like permease family protein [Streptomyces hainanensis]
MLRLAADMARRRISALSAVACAVLGGAALITGTGVLAESGLRSHLPAGRLGGVDVVVAADQTYRPAGDLPIALPERGRVPADLVGRLADVPGVTAAVGDLGFPAALVDAEGRVVPTEDPGTAGHGWASTGLVEDPRVDGAPPTGAGEVALDADLAAAANVRVGDRVPVVVAGEPAAHRVTALVDTPGAGILFADPTAAELAAGVSPDRAGTVDLIGLRAEPGRAAEVADAVRDTVDDAGLTVVEGADRGDLAAPGAAASRSLLVLLAGSLAGVILLVTGFAMAGALAVSVAGQRRELALMRAVGATPRQIRHLAATQATVIAAMAAVPGIALGYPLAELLRAELADRGVLPEALPLAVGPLPALATVLLVGLVVQLSARGAAWRTSRMPATEAVAESRVEPRTPSRARTGAGLLVIAAATTLSVAPLLSRSAIGAAGTSLAGIVGAIGLAMAGPALVRRASETLAGRLRPGVSAPTWLAAANVRGYALRLAGVVSTLAMAVAFVLTYVLAQTTVLAATDDDVETGTLAQHRLTAPALGGLPPDVLPAVRATPGVRAAVPLTTTTVIWTYRMFGEPEVETSSALVLDRDAPAVLDLDVRSGSLADLTGDTVAVSEDAARTRGAEPGDRIELVLGDGTPVRPTVVAVYDRGLGFGPVAVSRDLAAGHTTTGLDQSLLVRTDDDPAAGPALAELVGDRPGLALEATALDTGGEAPPEVWLNLAVIVVLLGYLLLSIANKLVATTAQRRSEIAALRLIGTTPRQIRAMMRREAALITVAALATGLALAAVPLALLGQGFLGRPWPAGPPWLLPATALTVAAIAFLTTELPTRRALRTPPAEALAGRE